MARHWVRRARVDIIPLLDVLTIMVFFFLVFGSIDDRAASLPVSVPDSRTALPPAARQLVVTLDRTGLYSVAGRILAASEMPGFVADAVKESPGIQVVLLPDKAVSYEMLVTALDLIREGGVIHPALGVRQRELKTR